MLAQNFIAQNRGINEVHMAIKAEVTIDGSNWKTIDGVFIILGEWIQFLDEDGELPVLSKKFRLNQFKNPQ